MGEVGKAFAVSAAKVLGLAAGFYIVYAASKLAEKVKVTKNDQ